MNGILKNSFFILTLLGVLSCTHNVPYEVKSPCVSVDGSDHTYGINPCIRRPANINYAIS